MEQMERDVQSKVVAIPKPQPKSPIEENIRFIIRTILKDELKPLMRTLIRDDSDIQLEIARCYDDDIENKVEEHFNTYFESSFNEHTENLEIRVDSDAFYIQGR